MSPEREKLIRDSWERARAGVRSYLTQTGARYAEMAVLLEPISCGPWPPFPGNAEATVEITRLDVKWLSTGSRFERLPLFRTCDVSCDGLHLDRLSGV